MERERTLRQIINKIVVLIAVIGILVVGFYGCEKREAGTEKTTEETEKATKKTEVKEKIEQGEKTKEKMANIKKEKDRIKTEAEGATIKYQQQSFYSLDSFSTILARKEEFKNQLIREFKKKIIGVQAENCRVDLNESEQSTVLKCDIKGARYGTNSYNMHFLLNGTKRFGFDLYGFKEIGKKFVYEGKINGIPFKIIFEFPYEFGHCHEHVWPK